MSPKCQVPRKSPLTAPRPQVPAMAPKTQPPWSARLRPRTSKLLAPDARFPRPESSCVYCEEQEADMCARVALNMLHGRRAFESPDFDAAAAAAELDAGCADPQTSGWAGATRDRPLDRNFGAGRATGRWTSPSAFSAGNHMCASPIVPARVCQRRRVTSVP